MSSAQVISITCRVFALVVECLRAQHLQGERKCCHDSRYSSSQVACVFERVSSEFELWRSWPACPPPLDLLAGSQVSDGWTVKASSEFGTHGTDVSIRHSTQRPLSEVWRGLEGALFGGCQPGCEDGRAAARWTRRTFE